MRMANVIPKTVSSTLCLMLLVSGTLFSRSAATQPKKAKPGMVVVYYFAYAMERHDKRFTEYFSGLQYVRLNEKTFTAAKRLQLIKRISNAFRTAIKRQYPAGNVVWPSIYGLDSNNQPVFSLYMQLKDSAARFGSRIRKVRFRFEEP